MNELAVCKLDSVQHYSMVWLLIPACWQLYSPVTRKHNWLYAARSASSHATHRQVKTPMKTPLLQNIFLPWTKFRVVNSCSTRLYTTVKKITRVCFDLQMFFHFIPSCSVVYGTKKKNSRTYFLTDLCITSFVMKVRIKLNEFRGKEWKMLNFRKIMSDFQKNLITFSKNFDNVL